MFGFQFSKDGDTEWVTCKIQSFSKYGGIDDDKNGIYDQVKEVNIQKSALKLVSYGKVGGRSSNTTKSVQPIGLVGFHRL